MARNTDMQRSAPEHQKAAYQRDTSTQEDTPWLKCHWTENFRYPRT